MKVKVLGVNDLFLAWIVTLFIIQVSADEIPPPQDVRVDSVLRWRPATEHPHHVKYTVQYLIFNHLEWQKVPGCVQTELTTCDIASISMHGCVMLRVHALEGGRTSVAVQAYGYGDDNTCSPVFTLIPRPGSLTVQMLNNSLSYAYGDHAEYLINYSRDGHPSQVKKSLSSVTLVDLVVGERYCVEVQYILYLKPYGPPSRTHCEVIPVSDKDRENKTLVITLPILLALGVLVVGSAFVITRNYEKMKQFLQPPMKLPPHVLKFFESPCSIPPLTIIPEEDLDKISVVLLRDDESGGFQPAFTVSEHT